MKKIFLGLMFSLALITQVQAGFFTSFAASALANDLSKGGIPASRIKKLNSYLWNMHKSGKYDKNYRYYLKYLETHTENISYLDTVAQVYLDKGNKKKALAVYEKRILPWLVIEDQRTQDDFRNYYKKIKQHK